ncbi:MAG: hemophilus-specific protein [Deltaproteobacteria bacterium]|nr:MAG: hemophilus-specific protein [Deltaproteobacteria bacterium]
MPSGITTQADVRNLSLGGGNPARPPQDRNTVGIPAPVQNEGSQGMLRVISNGEMQNAEMAEQEQIRREASQAEEFKKQGIAGHIRTQFFQMRSDRETRGISNRLVESLRAYRGEYTPQKLTAIAQFGGSEVYAKLTQVKCRGATSMLRDIYLSGDRPWFIEPTPDPTLPEDVTKSVLELVTSEVAKLQEAGQPIDHNTVTDRIKQLTGSAKKAALKEAKKEADKATRYLDDMLVEGKFYEKLTEFLHNIAIFPYAFMKGPVVRMATDVKWENGKAVVKDIPKMYWTAPSPFDIYWSSQVDYFENSPIIEHLRLQRSDLNNLIGVPGYDEAAIRAALEEYGQGGLSDWLDYTDTEKAHLEGRQDPHINHSDEIDTLEFHGNMQGKMLLEYGFTAEEVPDEQKDYFCTAWLVGYHIIKVQIDPNPRKRHPYYKSSFEKIPGAIIGNGVPEIMSDVQDVANASLRALVNNLSIASGPQVVINDDRVSPNTNTDDLYPWKRWHTLTDPFGSSEKAIDFFQPDSRSAELIAVYEKMSILADEISAIPRYMTGSAAGQGAAGRTASGLSMLMENAGKIMQSVAANIDTDIFQPLLARLYDTVLLTDESGRLNGDENIRVRGVTFANQRETERARILEFLQLTANPMDAQIVGMEGRAELLRETADRIGLDYASIVPDEEAMAGRQMQQPDGGTQEGKPGTGEAGAVDEGMKGAQFGPGGKAV